MGKWPTIKSILYAGVLAFLFIPMIQEFTGFKEVFPLEGAYSNAQKPEFSEEGWFSGKYQEEYGNWYGEQFGFRNNLVKLHNQVEFDLFRIVNAKGVFAFRDDYLFEITYLDAYRGKNYEGLPLLRTSASRMKALQDSLAKSGKTFLFVIAPSKCYYFPEYLPDHFKEGEHTNYKELTRLVDSLGVNVIDFNKLFVQSKKTSPYPLYPKTGVHWSRYGSTIAADSIIHWIEWKRGIDMAGLQISGVEKSTTPRDPDDDMGKSMNLYFPIHAIEMGYPKYTFEKGEGKVRPSLFAVGDSYFWSLWDMGLRDSVFSQIDFWYYNKEASYSDGRPKEDISTRDRMAEAKNHDVVILICTDPNLGQAGWGFLAQALEPASPDMIKKRQEEIKKKMQDIRNIPDWYNDVIRKAKERNIPVDSMLYLDAVYVIEHEGK